MFKIDTDNSKASDILYEKGYWPARAARYLKEGKYSKVVELYKENLNNEKNSLSVLLIYGQALFQAGQLNTASEQFYKVLTIEPNNIVALKYLGDIKFAGGDTVSAFNLYKKILDIDPETKILINNLSNQKKEITHVITLKKGTEDISQQATIKPTRNIPFYTETMADLYLEQGYPKLAFEVYQNLETKKSNSRISQKMTLTQEMIKEKEKNYVKKTD